VRLFINQRVREDPDMKRKYFHIATEKLQNLVNILNFDPIIKISLNNDENRKPRSNMFDFSFVIGWVSDVNRFSRPHFSVVMMMLILDLPKI
jgi:hypothetical protein